MKYSPTKKIVIAIDGFSSCGKSTFAKEIAARIGYVFIDTGAMYRAVTLYGLRHGAVQDGDVNEALLIAMLPEIEITFAFNSERGASDIFLNGENVEKRIRSIEVSDLVSKVSGIAAVREQLVRQQQQLGRQKGIVMDGRDIGTVVFPDAELKIFMTADPAIRAQRRYKELEAKGEKVSLEEVERNLRRPGQQPHDPPRANGLGDAADRKNNLRSMYIEIDDKSGFCFGVVKAITKAEESLAELGKVFSLGDIVHNRVEVQRLEKLGLETIAHSHFPELDGQTVLIRAHGEPPTTYALAAAHRIRLIDATCPVVARLQTLVKKAHEQMSGCNGQVVILGKRGHAEVVGLTGQVDGDAIVIETLDDLDNIDFTRPVYLLSQTTQSLALFEEVHRTILERSADPSQVTVNDTICRQVSNRNPHLKEFVRRFDVVIFVCGRKSSNGKVLYQTCTEANPRCYNIEDEQELQREWFDDCRSVGICGATSTPKWLMQRVADTIRKTIG